AERAERVMQLRAAAQLFEDRLDYPSGPSEWQKYLYEMVEKSSVSMPRQEKATDLGIYDFKQVRFPVEVSGTYAQIWTFVDLIERGPRIMRFEKLQLNLGDDGTLTLKCDLLGISRTNLGGEADASMENKDSSTDWSEEEDIA
ncbi:MAG: hypothetical protein QM477_12285, partial [Planctomycetota bacterium]